MTFIGLATARPDRAILATRQTGVRRRGQALRGVVGILSELGRSLVDRLTAVRQSRSSMASASVLSLGLLTVIVFGSGRDPVEALIERPLLTTNAYCASPLIQTDLAVGRMIGLLLPGSVGLVGEGFSPSDDILAVDTFGEGRTDQPEATVLFRLVRSARSTEIQAGAFQANGSPFGTVGSQASVEQSATVNVSARTLVRALPSRDGAFLLLSGQGGSALLFARLGDVDVPPELVLLDDLAPAARSLRVLGDTALISFAASGSDLNHQLRSFSWAGDVPSDEILLESMSSGEFVVTPEGALIVAVRDITGQEKVVVHRSVESIADAQPVTILDGSIIAVDGSPDGRSVLVTDPTGDHSVLTIESDGSATRFAVSIDGRPLSPLSVIVRDGSSSSRASRTGPARSATASACSTSPAMRSSPHDRSCLRACTARTLPSSGGRRSRR
jgi:hypothetical protein